MLPTRPVIVAFGLSLALLAGCAHKASGRIAGTKIPDDDVNRTLLDVMETYRSAVEAGDSAALLLMASPDYYEDRGTVESKDDYGFAKLQEILEGRFQLASDVRYSLRYDRILRTCPSGGTSIEKGCRAHVEVQIDASFTVTDARGEPYRKDKRDQNELVLVYTGDKWLFTSGM